MKTRCLMILAVLILAVLALVAQAQAIPDIWGVWTWDHTETVHVLTVPGGGGPPLTSAEYFGGTPTDATIRIQLWAQGDNPEDPQPPAPVANFPAEDIWLAAPGLVPCPFWPNPDADTDDEGWFTFALPLTFGGWMDPEGGPSDLLVFVNGSALSEENGPPISPGILINSPDIDGSGYVNLADVGYFAYDFFEVYHFRSDFIWDGVLNLADVGKLAAALGQSCD
jgi:hypothetical protein